MTKKEYKRFIDNLFYNSRKIHSINIEYYDRITHKNAYKVIHSQKGIIGKPYINGLNMLIDPGSMFEAINPNEDIEINGDNIMFHCGERITEKQERKFNGVTYSGTVTIGYKEHDFFINRKYILKYYINYML